MELCPALWGRRAIPLLVVLHGPYLAPTLLSPSLLVENLAGQNFGSCILLLLSCGAFCVCTAHCVLATFAAMDLNYGYPSRCWLLLSISLSLAVVLRITACNQTP